ncbi:MAG: AI-2E family transporter, partial [Acutalibacteraceae bacterium]
MVTSMELDRKTVKKILLIITFGIVLFLGLQNISAVAGVCRTALGLLMPLIIGFCAAFILNVLLKVIEERLFAPLNRKNFRLWSRLRRIVSIILTFGIIIGLVFILIFMIVPELKRAFSLLVENMPQYSMQVKEWITKAAAFLKVDASTLTNLEIDWEKISAAVVDYLKRDSGKLVNTTVGITTSIFSAIFNFILGIVFSVYILMQKEKLGSQATRML